MDWYSVQNVSKEGFILVMKIKANKINYYQQERSVSLYELCELFELCSGIMMTSTIIINFVLKCLGSTLIYENFMNSINL